LVFSKNSGKGRTRKASFKIPSEIKYIKKSSGRILGDLAAVADESTLFDIRLCVEEAVRNAIVHGNHCEKKFSVRIAYSWNEAKIVIEVEDQGKGFDYKHLPDPTDSAHILRNSGRGVYLIHHLMDEVDYNDTGSRVTMTRYL
jgi:serine/threonine-protein kinase RsbW